MNLISDELKSYLAQEAKTKGLSFLILLSVLYYFYDVSKQDREIFVSQMQKSELRVEELTKLLVDCYETKLENHK